jgi:hypothetical protein
LVVQGQCQARARLLRSNDIAPDECEKTNHKHDDNDDNDDNYYYYYYYYYYYNTTTTEQQCVPFVRRVLCKLLQKVCPRSKTDRDLWPTGISKPIRRNKRKTKT